MGGVQLGWMAEISVPITRALGYFSATSQQLAMAQMARRRSQTFHGPHAGSRSEIYNLLWRFAYRGEKVLAIEDVVEI